MKTGLFSHIDASIAHQEKEAVVRIIREGRVAQKTLELAIKTLAWTDYIIAGTEAEPPLSRPIVCQTGCHFCCFNQVEVTPPEALVIGDFVEHTFTADEKTALLAELDRAVQFKSDKTKVEIAHLRQELRCPLLRCGRCAVYEVRPLVCRAIHSLNADHCELALRLGKNTGVEHYSHRDEIVGSLLHGLMEGCREMGCQADPLDLARALLDFFAGPSPLERWIEGEQIFTPLHYAES
jgi:hypothetical protein